MEVPHRHDLMETSVVNEEVKIVNRKLNDVTSKYGHTSIMHIGLAREDFTRHGMHLRNSGKDKLLTLLTEKFEIQQRKTQVEMPIKLKWKEDIITDSVNEQRIPRVAEQTAPPRRRRKIPTTRNKDFLWE